MVNTGKLKEVIREKGFTIASLSSAIGMDDSTFYRKIGGGGGNFTLAEADLITSTLGLDADIAQKIFFDN